MCRLVASEFEKISHGAPSGPDISVLNVMPFALVFMRQPATVAFTL